MTSSRKNNWDEVMEGVYLNDAAVKPYGMVGHYQNQNAPQPAVEV